MRKTYITRDSLSGTIIDEFVTREEAEAAIRGYEAQDKADGNYEPNFYEVAEVEANRETKNENGEMKIKDELNAKPLKTFRLMVCYTEEANRSEIEPHEFIGLFATNIEEAIAEGMYICAKKQHVHAFGVLQFCSDGMYKVARFVTVHPMPSVSKEPDFGKYKFVEGESYPRYIFN